MFGRFQRWRGVRGQPPGSAPGSSPEYPPALGARRSTGPFALALESTRKKRELELVTLAGRHQISDLGLIRRAGMGSDAWRTGGSRVVDGRGALLGLRRRLSAFSAEGAQGCPTAAIVPLTAFRQPCDASTHFSSRLSPCTGPRCAHPRRRESLRAACRRDDAQKEGRRAGPALRS